MSRLIVICEGPTEEEFCKKILYPYFQSRNIFVESPLIKHSNGGIVGWSALKKQIENHLKQDLTVYVTLLIDYYGIQQKLEYPGWEEALRIADKNERLDFLQLKMSEDIDDALRFRFIPYVQLHEFEGLLFNNIGAFSRVFTDDEIQGKEELQDVLATFDNPELINDSPETAPSKRLMRIIKGYNKVVFGNILAEAIGLENIKSKCPRFNHWINLLTRLS